MKLFVASVAAVLVAYASAGLITDDIVIGLAGTGVSCLLVQNEGFNDTTLGECNWPD